MQEVPQTFDDAISAHRLRHDGGDNHTIILSPIVNVATIHSAAAVFVFTYSLTPTLILW